MSPITERALRSAIHCLDTGRTQDARDILSVLLAINEPFDDSDLDPTPPATPRHGDAA